MLQDILITGLINGGVYALLAIGFSLIFGVARIVNIAHTAFYMLAAYCFYTLLVVAKLDVIPAGILAIVAVTALSVLCYKFIIEPVREHQAAVLIATIALATIFQELMQVSFGGNYLGIPSTIDGAFAVGGTSIPWQRVLIVVVAAVMLVITWWVLYQTRLGLAIRATANDREVATLMGMNADRVAMASVAISVALAAVAGVVVAPVFVVDPRMWLAPLVTMLAIVVLGGLGSLKGSLIGALIIGYVEAITVYAVPSGAYLKGAIALSIMIVVLLVRPEGLFGVALRKSDSPMYLIRRAWANIRNEILVLPSRTLVALWVLGLALLPLVWPDPYILRIVTMTCLFAIFAASWDLLAGFAGQVSFGHALNFGAGAYASALLATHLGLSPWITVWLGALVAMLIGLLAGWLCLRLRGSYLSLATLALPIILIGILFAFPAFSGGELGISGLRRLATSPLGNYAIAAIAMLVSVFAMWLIADSKFGLVLHAIRDDEVAVRASGINTTRYKLAVFALSALFAGVSGALYSHFLRVAGPSTLEVALSFQVVIWGIFGGAATIYGPVAAVFLLYPFTEWLGNFQRLSELRLLIFAVTVLVILLFMPRGLVPWVRDKIETACPRCKARNAAWRGECRLCGAGLKGLLTAAQRSA